MDLEDARIQFDEVLQQDLDMSESSNVERSQYNLWNTDFSFDPSLFDPIVEPANYSSQKLPETTTEENGSIPPHVGT